MEKQGQQSEPEKPEGPSTTGSMHIINAYDQSTVHVNTTANKEIESQGNGQAVHPDSHGTRWGQLGWLGKVFTKIWNIF